MTQHLLLFCKEPALQNYQKKQNFQAVDWLNGIRLLAAP